MSVVPGTPLKDVWDSLDDKKTRDVCVEIWTMIAKLRTIQKPPELQNHFLCLADGSPCIQDPLVAGGYCASPAHDPLLDNDAVRAYLRVLLRVKRSKI